ncbi:MAG: hypothetical protein J0I91_18810 [Candidatus Accumulibacter sp.]|nr:hypothetical protein [Accumulibacter sp.]
MKIIYISPNYSAAAVTARYVRRSVVGDGYEFAEVGADSRYDIRRGDLTATEVPDALKIAADALRMTWPGNVRWPDELVFSNRIP